MEHWIHGRIGPFGRETETEFIHSPQRNRDGRFPHGLVASRRFDIRVALFRFMEGIEEGR